MLGPEGRGWGYTAIAFRAQYHQQNYTRNKPPSNSNGSPQKPPSAPIAYPTDGLQSLSREYRGPRRQQSEQSNISAPWGSSHRKKDIQTDTHLAPTPYALSRQPRTCPPQLPMVPSPRMYLHADAAPFRLAPAGALCFFSSSLFSFPGGW